MKRYLLGIFFILIGLFLVFASNENLVGTKELDLTAKPKDVQTVSGVRSDINFGKIPLHFVRNKGQVNEKVRFYAKTSRYTLWLTNEGLVFDSTRQIDDERLKSDEMLHGERRFARDVSQLTFLNSKKNPTMIPIDKAKLKVNYFIGNDKSKWNCGVPTSKAVLYKNLYKNIDLKVYGLEEKIEYDWIVKAGGKVNDIKIRYKHVKGTRIDQEGNLLIETDFGELIHKKPVSYQEFGKERKEIVVSFKKIAKNTYGFGVGDYDRSRELVIDPVVLAYSTYLGGGGTYNSGYSIAVDADGFVYVTGYVDHYSFPILDQFQEYQSGSDAFVSKLDPSLSGTDSLIYSTFLGGSSGDIGNGIAIDTSGNAYVTGTTSSPDFPTMNQYQTFQKGSDVFVTKLDTNQSGVASLLYSTCLGSGGGGGVYSNDQGRAIDVDSNGYVYVTGETYTLYCQDFPTLNQYQGAQGVSDVFVTKLNPNASGTDSLLYSTYLGGGSHEYGRGIAVGSDGYVYVTGYTRSGDFPTRDQFQQSQGDWDAFVVKMDLNQSGDDSLIYSTYLGGSGGDTCTSVAVDSSNNVYITGATSSTNFPTLNQYQLDPSDTTDIFVSKLDPTRSGTSGLLYSTYLGGDNGEEGKGIAVDGNGNVYVTGFTYSTDFPTLNQYQNYLGDNDVDIFVSSIDTTKSGVNSLLYSTYLVAGRKDFAYAIAVDYEGNAYVTGSTTSYDFPILNQYQDVPGSGQNVYVSKLSFGTVNSITVTSPNGGEEWPIGSVQNIAWTATGETNSLKISLWKDGQLLGNIADNISPSTNSYTWTVGLHSGGMAESATGYTVRIEENGTTVSDDSDTTFTLTNDDNVTVLLLDSNGNGLSGGTVQYYNAGWQPAGTTDQDGRLTIEMATLKSYTFRMSYAGASIDQARDVSVDPVVIFQTASVTVQLKDSSGNPLDTGTVSYYASGWKAFGVTTGGEVSKELLPRSYTFRMAYGGASIDQARDVSVNPVVTFQTASVTVQLKDSSGNPLDTGTVSYYASGWKAFGVTTGGEVSKELLPRSYTFRMDYGGASIDQARDVSVDPVVIFQTSSVTVQLKDSNGNPLDTGTVSYYASGWKAFGVTTGGEVSKELLPRSYTFRMAYGGASIDQAQDVSVNPLIIYQTGKVVSASNSCTNYYASGWQTFISGMELLPVTYTFRFNDTTPDTQYSIVAGIDNEIH